MVTKNNALRLLCLHGVMLLATACTSNAMEKSKTIKQRRQSWPNSQTLSDQVNYLSAIVAQMQATVQNQADVHREEILKLKQTSNETRNLFLAYNKNKGSGLIDVAKQAPSDYKIQQILKLVQENGKFLDEQTCKLKGRITVIEEVITILIEKHDQDLQKKDKAIRELSKELGNCDQSTCEEFKSLQQLLYDQNNGYFEYDDLSIGTPTASLKAPLCDVLDKQAPEEYGDAVFALRQQWGVVTKN